MWNTIGQGLQPVLGAASSVLEPFRVKPQPVHLPQKVSRTAPTAYSDIDAALDRLNQRKSAWVGVSCSERANMLEECLQISLKEAWPLASTSTQTKGSYGGGIGEELVNITPLVVALREYTNTMRANGRPEPLGLRKRRNGQWAASVFPSSYLPLLFTNFNAEVWIQPGKEPSQGGLYRAKDAGQVNEGAIALVLGAGNQVTVVCLDLLHKLLAEDEVVVVKMNPVNESLAPHLARVFDPFIRNGFLEFVFGGGEEGQYLCEHPLVSSIHITGAVATFNSIVWGSPTAPKDGTPKLQKPIGAELGNVTPCIVVPGEWSQSDLDAQADTVLAGLANNSGHNCVAFQVIITDGSWPQREAFLDAVRRKMASVQRRAGWYAGSGERLARFKQQFPRAEELGRVDPAAQGFANAAAEQQPFMLAAGLTAEEAQLQQEWWCCVLQEVPLQGTGGDPGKFMAAATEFANSKCWGTLGVTMLIHPATQEAHQDAFETALEDLKYGSVLVNAPVLAGFGMPATTWGAYPGNTLQDIGSGNCYVHNTFLMDHPEKSVIYAPWHLNPKPFWSATSTNGAGMMYWAYRVIAGSNKLFPGLIYVLGAAWNALRN